MIRLPKPVMTCGNVTQIRTKPHHQGNRKTDRENIELRRRSATDHAHADVDEQQRGRSPASAMSRPAANIRLNPRTASSQIPARVETVQRPPASPSKVSTIARDSNNNRCPFISRKASIRENQPELGLPPAPARHFVGSIMLAKAEAHAVGHHLSTEDQRAGRPFAADKPHAPRRSVSAVAQAIIRASAAEQARDGRRWRQHGLAPVRWSPAPPAAISKPDRYLAHAVQYRRQAMNIALMRISGHRKLAIH